MIDGEAAVREGAAARSSTVAGRRAGAVPGAGRP